MKNILQILFVFITGVLVLCAGTVSAAPVVDHNYELVSSTRAGRTDYDYTYKAKIINNNTNLLNVAATVSSSSPNTKIIDGNVHFGNLPAGASLTSADTFTIRQNRSFVFDPNTLVWNVQFEIAPQIIPPGGGEIQGENDIVLIVPAGATNVPIQVKITPLQEEELGASAPPNTTFLGGTFIDMGQDELADNADISMPAPSGVPDGAEVYLAKTIEYAGQTMFQLVDTAIVENGIITSQDPAFPGVKNSGKYIFLWAQNVGWVGGQVKRSNVAVEGAVVTLSGGYWLDIANSSGTYILPAWAGNFVVVAFDPITADHGDQQGYMPFAGASVLANVTIGTSTGTIQSTIINGDFETGDLTGWQLSGGGEVVSSFGPIVPFQGNFMGKITTGENAVGGASSALEQSFKVPAGATILTLRYNFVSDEYPEYVGSSFNDVFNATLFTPDGSREIAFEEVNSAPFSPVSGMPDGTWGQTGWREAHVNVSAWAGKNDTITLSVHDVGDTVVDTVVLLDGIIFGTNYPIIQSVQNARDNLGKTSGSCTWEDVTFSGVWADGIYTYCARFVRMCFGVVHSFSAPDALTIYNHYNDLGLIKTDKKPPVGAVVFYAAHTENWDAGHVGIVSEAGKLISVTSLTTGVNETNIFDFFAAQYLGYVTADVYINNH
jgi:hypothetical protein